MKLAALPAPKNAVISSNNAEPAAIDELTATFASLTPVMAAAAVVSEALKEPCVSNVTLPPESTLATVDVMVRFHGRLIAPTAKVLGVRKDASVTPPSFTANVAADTVVVK